MWSQNLWYSRGDLSLELDIIITLLLEYVKRFTADILTIALLDYFT
jgi:hypothetical protein